MRSADQNFAEKDIESLDWNELLNLKRSFSSYLKQLTNDIIEIETLDYHFQRRDDFHPDDGQYKEWVYHI